MSDENSKKVLKILHPFNDYVAIMRDIKIPEGIELPKESLEKMSNEGIVIGIGPDAKEFVELGDVVVFQRAGKKLTITPETGCYADKSLVMVHYSDLVLSIRHSDDYEFATDLE